MQEGLRQEFYWYRAGWYGSAIETTLLGEQRCVYRWVCNEEKDEAERIARIIGLGGLMYYDCHERVTEMCSRLGIDLTYC